MYINQHKDCDKSEAKSIKELFTYVIVQEFDMGCRLCQNSMIKNSHIYY